MQSAYCQMHMNALCITCKPFMNANLIEAKVKFLIKKKMKRKKECYKKAIKAMKCTLIFQIELLGFYLSYFSAAGRKQWFVEWDSIYTWGFASCCRMHLKFQSML